MARIWNLETAPENCKTSIHLSSPPCSSPLLFCRFVDCCRFQSLHLITFKPSLKKTPTFYYIPFQKKRKKKDSWGLLDRDIGGISSSALRFIFTGSKIPRGSDDFILSLINGSTWGQESGRGGWKEKLSQKSLLLQPFKASTTFIKTTSALW